LRGEQVEIQVEAPDTIRFGNETLKVIEGNQDYRPLMEKYLRELAVRELPARVKELEALHGFSVRRITIRNQRTRWGSCSRTGAISLNWRLIQTPDFVRDYIILHELAHLRHMNHSDLFWDEVQRLCPEYFEAEKWLKQNRGFLN
jgi:predicted metal-dependent hydrolase